jgi:phosphoribosylaminoimidazolecarboxamide formyltransferase/IMP cyclohydrolase
MKQLKDMGIAPIDLLAVNLYPFRQAAAKKETRPEEAAEQIDIGGPAMIRAAAKNYERVLVLVSPEQYAPVLRALQETGDAAREQRLELAAQAFAHIAEYDAYIARYLADHARGGAVGLPRQFAITGTKVTDLRYGENPHQKAALYRWHGPLGEGGVSNARQIQGKALSYNNIVDIESAWKVASEFTEPAATIIKHTNPCGTALGTDIANAYTRALDADPVSAFGGIIGLNQTVDKKAASLIVKTFMEAVVAPGYTEEALETLVVRKNLRILEMASSLVQMETSVWIEPVSGGFLIQDLDVAHESGDMWRVMTKKSPDQALLDEMLFAWRIVKHIKSNGIVVTKDKASVGIGSGQTNRVGAVKIALEQAGEKARNAVLASDAFFPFGDSVEMAAKYGISAIVQPGGSIRDQESIERADAQGMAMVFTDIRHFKH